MKVYIDVTNLVSVNFLTGIQRVVREVAVRMLKRDDLEVVLLAYAEEKKCFDILSNEEFLKIYLYDKGDKNALRTHKRCTVEEIESGAVFFDIDSVWNSRLRRSDICPVMKANGVKLAVFVHDIIPVTHPQFSHSNTMYFFMNYIGAYLQYADIIITSTQSTLDEINKLSDELKLERKQGYVTSLGADFKLEKKQTKNEVSDEVKEVVKDRKYILLVGTIEPRKNHKVVLEAFDKCLFDRGLSLVFAGRIGWNIQEFEERIKKHPMREKKFFHISNATDEDINYLYKNAYMMAFPTYTEGFGLPLIEALERKTPVIACNCSVLREIGKEFCEYFSPDDAHEFANRIEKYLDDEEAYKKIKKKIGKFKPDTWDDVSIKMIDALKSLESKSRINVQVPKQIVFLSARQEMLLDTLPFIEKFMPFVEEAVICCPDKMVDSMKKSYRGTLRLSFLTDSEVLNGAELPEDHSKRNFFLRCLAMRSEKISENFIMCDDDYRPLRQISEDVFVKAGKYQGYYCFNLTDWKGTPGAPTSYDNCMFKTAAYLKQYQYPLKLYASHMPQPMNKKVFCEMLDEHKGIENLGLDEWSTYFNFLHHNYPDKFNSNPYVTMGWPGAPTDWELQVEPEQYLFENYYPEAYEKGGVFEGYSTTMCNEIIEENFEKCMRFRKAQDKHERDRAIFYAYERMYQFQRAEAPRFTVVKLDKTIIYLPEYVVIEKSSCNKILFFVQGEFSKGTKLEYYYTKLNGDRLTMPDGVELRHNVNEIELPVYGLKYEGKYLLHISVMETGKASESSVLCVMI